MYGAKVQHANPLDTSPPLNKAGKKFIQEIMGEFLYLAQAVDSTMLTVLSSTASKQAALTEKMMQKMPTILRLRSITRQHNCHILSKRHETRDHSDALYLSEPKACSRAGGHMFMASNEDFPSTTEWY